ncbi:hypothetical protein [Staphylococcus gallinarum]|uniref:hypothetical protein n=1 Tax=Staphylococcus gallinarum TaxID=1293 RepID=UPI001E6594BB|nr:hypothetical protein [Staphylococcus gallinarum]MCD8845150.1 hypothetical protein [Staphylococcus gallinarum]
MTVSNLDQELKFSQTGSEVKLHPQKRYKDMTVIPFKIDSGDKQSLNAKDYLVGLMNKDGKINHTASASLVSFSSDGEMAIVLKGDYPKEPLQIILQNNNDFEQSESGEKYITIWGQDQKVKYNGVGFTVNPKGNNVKNDSRISQDMRMKDLYLVSKGDREYKKLDKEESNTKKRLKTYKKKQKENERQIMQLNEALHKDKDDFNKDESSDDSSSTNYESTLSDSDYDNLEDSDLSTNDMKDIRSSHINELQNTKDSIKEEKRNLEGINNTRKQLDNLVSKMNDLTTLSNKYQWLKGK